MSWWGVSPFYPSSQSSEVSARSEKPGSKDDVCCSTYLGFPTFQLTAGVWMPSPRAWSVFKHEATQATRSLPSSGQSESSAGIHSGSNPSGRRNKSPRAFPVKEATEWWMYHVSQLLASCSPSSECACWVPWRAESSSLINSCDFSLQYKLRALKLNLAVLS